MHYTKNESTKITRTKFENNLNLKLQEHNFLDDINQLLSADLKKSHSVSLTTEDGKILVTEKNERIQTEGWSLLDAAKEITDKILTHLPDKRLIEN